MFNKKAFTLIELLIVISILGILLLIAIPSFKGYTEKAKIIKVKSDVKIAQNLVSGAIDGIDFERYNIVPKEKISEVLSKELIYNSKGIVSKVENDFYELDYELLKELIPNPSGSFISSKEGEVLILVENGFFKGKGSQFDKDGFDKDGFDKDGFDKDGFDKDGFDKDGFDKDGFDKDGFDKDGYNREGYDKNGYDKDNLSEIVTKKYSEYKSGDVIMLGGVDWILLDKEKGYLILRGKKGSLYGNGLNRQVQFDSGNTPIFNPNRIDNIAYDLNQIAYFLPNYSQKRDDSHVKLIKQSSWNIGGVKFEDVYGKYWNNPGDGLTLAAIEKKEASRKASSYGGLLSVSEYLKYSKKYAHYFGLEGVLEEDFFFENNGDAWLINTFIHDDNKYYSSVWSMGLERKQGFKIAQSSNVSSKSYLAPTIYIDKNAEYSGYILKK